MCLVVMRVCNSHAFFFSFFALPFAPPTNDEEDGGGEHHDGACCKLPGVNVQ